MLNFPRPRGRSLPRPLPAWRQGKALNQWFAIAGTAGAAGARLDQYCGCAKVGTFWVSPAAGGHVTLDNRVCAIDLAADSPTWSQRKAASSSPANGAPYYSDGRPIAGHYYASAFGINDHQVMRPGIRFSGTDQVPFDKVDVFDLSTNQWAGVVPDSPGTSGSGYADVSPSGYFPVAQDHEGNLWCILHSNGNVAKYTVATNTWSQPAMANKVAANVRSPWALDTKRNQLFGLAWADGEGSGTGLRAVQLDYQAGTQRAITFSSGSSAAVAAFTADAPQYGGMDYDPINDRFLFFSGDENTVPVIYAVTPNGGTEWDMAVVTFGGATLPAVAGGSGLTKRLAYFPEFKCFAIMPDPLNADIYVLPLAN